jgi:hypothetical protein
MRSTKDSQGNARTFHRVALASALTLLATFSACKSPTDFDYPSTLTLVSGGNQTVTINPGGLADLPQPVVVRLERHGKPVQYSIVSAQVASAASSAPPRYYAFFTGSDGIAAMQLQADDTPGPFNIDVAFRECSDGGFCDETVLKATLRVTGSAVN